MPEPDPPVKEIVVRNNLAAAKQPEELLMADVRARGYSEDDAFAIKLALEEAMTNAVRHGNGNDPNKHVRVQFCVTPRQTTIIVADEGRGFRPDEVPDPTAPENLERPSGRGIMLMRSYMTQVTYNERGNEVTLVKVNEQ